MYIASEVTPLFCKDSFSCNSGENNRISERRWQVLDLLKVPNLGLASVMGVMGVLLGLDGGDGTGDARPMVGVTGEEEDIGEGN